MSDQVNPGPPHDLYRFIGQSQAAIKALEDRADRTDTRIEREIGSLRTEMISRFDGQDKRFDKSQAETNGRFDRQDSKLDLVVRKLTETDGQQGVWKVIRSSSFQLLAAAFSSGVFVTIGNWFLRTHP